MVDHFGTIAELERIFLELNRKEEGCQGMVVMRVNGDTPIHYALVAWSQYGRAVWCCGTTPA